MKIDWINVDNSVGAVTIYENNITLSKHAANYFLDAYAVAVGIDRESKDIVIKSLTKDEAKTQDKGRVHQISIKQSYGRINGKRLIEEIAEAISLDFSNRNAFKFNARWNTGYKMLVINTKEVK